MTKFARLVTALEHAGIKGHEAYELANQADLELIPDGQEEIAAQEIAQSHAEWIEALESEKSEKAE